MMIRTRYLAIKFYQHSSLEKDTHLAKWSSRLFNYFMVNIRHLLFLKCLLQK